MDGKAGGAAATGAAAAGNGGGPAAAAARNAFLENVRMIKIAKERILREVQKVIVGQTDVIEQVLIALAARGHCLLVGVPGLAKTLLVKTVAAALALEFKRVQFTPDLMPSDITGTEVLEENPATKERMFRFLRGPIFTNLLLADEINRTPPKTQAALLEAMQEGRVTAGGATHAVKPPFLVLATQNPIEQEGTYPLPEAQLDRFMFMLRLDYPARADEVAIVRASTQDADAQPAPVLSAEQIIEIQKIVRRAPVSDHVIGYATALARATRPKTPDAHEAANEYLSWGAGPRAAQCLVLGAKARALLDGRVNVSCADVRAVAEIVLRHRVFTNFQADSDGVGADTVIARILKDVPESGEPGTR
jgi:MoxR-like ATPase